MEHGWRTAFHQHREIISTGNSQWRDKHRRWKHQPQPRKGKKAA
jgi:hypothetical protein